MRSILVHADHDEACDRRLDAAIGLAKRHGAHLSAMIATPFQQYLVGDPFGGAQIAAEAFAAAQRDDASLEKRLRERLGANDLPWDILTASNGVIPSLAGAAIMADLAIVGLPESGKDDRRRQAMLAADLALATPAPVLALPGHTKAIPEDAPMLIAWNGSDEAARALRGALPLLSTSREILLLSVGETSGTSADDALLFLSRRDIKATSRVAQRVGLKAEERIEKEAEAMNAELIVMGAFGHHRMRETIFGGATQYLVRCGRFALLLAH